MKETPKKLLLNNSQSPGDMLVMTAAIESLHACYPGAYATAVTSPCNAVYENNHWVAKGDETFTSIKMEYPLIHQSNSRPVHFMQGYCDFLGAKLEIPLPLQVNRPSLYLSDKEKTWIPQVQEHTGKRIKYWVIDSGTKSDFTAKGWGYDNYQEVVRYLRGRVQFVQIGEKSEGHMHIPLTGVIDMVGRTDARQLIRLCYHAEGGLGPSTFIQHIFAAFAKPYVCLLGGREPLSWCHYPTQVTFANHAQLECWRKFNGKPGHACWKSRTVPLRDGDANDNSICEVPVFLEEPIPKCMAMIHPDRVAEAVLNFYEGGML